jgi:serine/threonine protein kinase
VGQVVGNYKITAKLGEGGMGVVYLAEHPVIGKKVALKVIHPDLARNPDVVSRFIMEAKSVNQIGHEHIVDIGDFGNTQNGEFYFIMEYLAGESLADRLKREARLSQARGLAIAAQIADALGASHDQGIIHRDLKPENIFLITRHGDPDFVKVLDFGLAKLTQVEEKVTHKTRAGWVMGTPYYMSPEQGEGKIEIDHRADVYSLGILVFEMLTGKVPFGGEGYGEIIVKHITHQAPSARKINPAISAAVEIILFRALAKDRDQRFQTMQEFRDALLDPEAHLEGSPPVALPSEVTNVNRMAKPMSRSEMHLDERDQVTPPPVPFDDENGAVTRPTPTPSTFGHAVGQVGDVPSLTPTLNRKLMLGVAGGLAALVIALILVGLLRHGNQTKEPVEEPAATTRSIANSPATVKLSFASDPTGATVTRVSDGVELGVTPFGIDVPYADVPQQFLLRKAGFEDKVLGVVPNLPVPVFVSLQAKATIDEGGGATSAAGITASAAARGKRKAFTHRPPSRAAPKSDSDRRAVPVDRDAVLEPDFK